MRFLFALHRAAFTSGIAITLFLATALSSPAQEHAKWARLTATPTSLNFGNVQVGNNQTLYETLNNTGKYFTMTISEVAIAGPGFSLSGITPPVVLTPGQHYTFTVTFTPQSATGASGSILVTSNAADVKLTIPLTGTGVAQPAGQLSVSPAAFAFGNVNVGSNASQQGTLTSSGNSVIVSSGTVSPSTFSLSGIVFPLTIPAGQNAQFTVTFAPQASGPASGTVSFTSNASNSPATAPLTGTGVSASHVVTLSWNADNSQGIVGYNIYRGSTSGGPYSRINSTLDPSTTYSDSSIADGQTYYYVTTAVNSTGEESGYSNETQAVIP
jgi:hypothetical protein